MRRRAPRLAGWVAALSCLAAVWVACDRAPGPGVLPSSLSPVPTADELAAYQSWVARAAAKGMPISRLYPTKSMNPSIIRELAIPEGGVVADIGCGTGGVEWALLDQQVPFGKIHAVDVEPAALDFVRFTLDTARPARAADIELVLSTRDSVRLPPNTVDVALLLNTPIHLNAGGLTGPDLACLASLFAALKPGGSLHVYDTENRRDRSIEMLRTRAREAFAAAGFTLMREEVVSLDDAPVAQRLATLHSVWQKPAR